MRLRGFYTTYITLYNEYTNSHIPLTTKFPSTLRERILSVGRLYGFTDQDYISCIHYCFKSNPLGFDDLRLYGNICNYIKSIAYYANAGKPGAIQSSNTELDNLWKTL